MERVSARFLLDVRLRLAKNRPGPKTYIPHRDDMQRDEALIYDHNYGESTENSCGMSVKGDRGRERERERKTEMCQCPVSSLPATCTTCQIADQNHKMSIVASPSMRIILEWARLAHCTKPVWDVPWNLRHLFRCTINDIERRKEREREMYQCPVS